MLKRFLKLSLIGFVSTLGIHFGIAGCYVALKSQDGVLFVFGVVFTVLVCRWCFLRLIEETTKSGE